MMVDITKQYVTRTGKRVINLLYVPFNSVGNRVTYPIKGSVVEREKPLKLRYQVWSVEGNADVLKKSNDDLFELI